MSKLGRVATKASYGILGIITKPLYDQMRKERKAEIKRYNSFLNEVSQNVIAHQREEMKPRTFEVHQPFDAIIHRHHLW